MISNNALRVYKAGKKMLRRQDEYRNFYPALDGFITASVYIDNLSVEEHGYIVSALLKYGRQG